MEEKVQQARCNKLCDICMVIVNFPEKLEDRDGLYCAQFQGWFALLQACGGVCRGGGRDGCGGRSGKQPACLRVEGKQWAREERLSPSSPLQGTSQ